MKTYTTLHNVVYDLKNLTDPQKNFIRRVIARYKKKPHWNNFSNYWIKAGKKIWARMEKGEVINHPTFKICQDLESRLGIEQGYVRQTDYRDKLLELIEKFPSRYRFCKEVGIDEALLSHVLAKKKNLSVTKLEGVLNKLNLEINFTEKQKTLQV